MLAALVVGMSSSLSLAQTNRGVTPVRPLIKPIKVSRLIGMNVENGDGQEFGKLRDLALNPRTGRIQYAIVASGGFLGLRAKLRAVPPHLLSAATAKRDTLAVKLALDDWNLAPLIRMSTLARPESRHAIDQFYGNLRTEPADGSTSGKGTLTRTGRDGENPAPADGPDELTLAGHLIGTVVRDRVGQKVGDIVDVLVVFDERVPAFAILSPGSFFKSRDRRYAVSLQAMHRDPNGRWTLNADRAALDRAPAFTGQLPGPGERGSRTELFRYYERK